MFKCKHTSILVDKVNTRGECGERGKDEADDGGGASSCGGLPSSWVQWAPGSSTVDTSPHQPSRDRSVHNLENFGWLRFLVVIVEKVGL